MLINFILWVLMGLGTGWLGYYFDKDKKKGVEIYLFAGLFIGYITAFIIHFLIWPVEDGEINFIALIFGSVITYMQLWVVDYFFHL